MEHRINKSIWITVLILAGIVITVGLAHIRAQPQEDGKVLIGGAFALTDTRGHGVQEKDFRGRLMLVYLGYSHCPDICPLTLGIMGDTLKMLGPDADKIAAIFITLDPERDTPQQLTQYLRDFDPRIIGLTGEEREINAVVKTYKAYHKKIPTPATESYLVDHSGSLYLMDRDGEYIAHFPSDVKTAELVKAIRGHL